MGKLFYQKLAFTNMRKNSQFEIPYLCTGIFTVCAFYMIMALSYNPQLVQATNSETIVSVMALAGRIVAIFSAIILFYTDSFLMKRRKKELGLYNILGMEKRHIGITLFFETLYSTVISLAGGLSAGLLLSKLVFMVCDKVADMKIGMNFFISWKATGITCLLFGGIFLLSFIFHLIQLRLNDPIQMLKGGSVGEKEPKAKWLLAMLGIGCIGTGYYISITTDNPLTAMSLFFLAVLLVIVGTYLLFTASTIAILKLMKKNKRYYYKPNHFTAVSGLMYRMKQNAAGLASICILLTMVLVMVSTTFSLYTGVDWYIDKMFAQNTAVCFTDLGDDLAADIEKNIYEIAEKHDLKVNDMHEMDLISFGAVRTENGYKVVPASYGYSDTMLLAAITLDDYNKLTNKNEKLAENEIMVFGEDAPAGEIDLCGTKVYAKKHTEAFPKVSSNYGFDTEFAVVRDKELFDKLVSVNEEVYEENASQVSKQFQFDLEGSNASQMAFKDDMLDKISKLFSDKSEKLAEEDQSAPYTFSVPNRSAERAFALQMYGGLLFVGVYLGSIFIMGMALIIYYKQLSEGYDDRSRFEIMQKVGMTHREVKKSINSQVLIVFFLPLITAICHLLAAYPMLRRILELFNLVDLTRFGEATAAVIVVFALIYFALYKITSKIYYNIVSR